MLAMQGSLADLCHHQCVGSRSSHKFAIALCCKQSSCTSRAGSILIPVLSIASISPSCHSSRSFSFRSSSYFSHMPETVRQAPISHLDPKTLAFKSNVPSITSFVLCLTCNHFALSAKSASGPQSSRSLPEKAFSFAKLDGHNGESVIFVLCGTLRHGHVVLLLTATCRIPRYSDSASLSKTQLHAMCCLQSWVSHTLPTAQQMWLGTGDRRAAFGEFGHRAFGTFCSSVNDQRLARSYTCTFAAGKTAVQREAFRISQSSVTETAS